MNGASFIGRNQLGKYARWDSTTVKLLGAVEVLFAIFLLVPTLIALWYGEDFRIFTIIIPPLAVAGVLQYILFNESKNFRAINGLLLMVFAWILVFLIGLVPFLLSGMSPLDALFESVSCLTTTGMSVVSDIDGSPNSLMVWRSLLQWIGGIAVIIIFMYILPMLGIGRSFFVNELAGSGSSEYSVRMGKAAKSFVLVYCIFSLANLVLLLVSGLGFVDSLCLMMSTVSNGGMLNASTGLTYYSDAAQWITIVFMFLSATNFYLHYRALYRHNKRVYRSNSEFKAMTFWFVLISLIITVILVNNTLATQELSIEMVYQHFKEVVFTTVSLGSTNGFFMTDHTTWPAQCTILLMIVAFIGASSGSTSGGVKIARLNVIYAFLKNSVSRILHPNAVYSVRIDDEYVDDKAVLSAISIFLVYFLTLIVGSVLLMLYGLDLVDSFGLSIAAISNGGIGVGSFGPSATFATLDPVMKCVLMALMWIGRLEILTALVLFTPGFWRELYLNHRANKRMKALEK